MLEDEPFLALTSGESLPNPVGEKSAEGAWYPPPDISLSLPLVRLQSATVQVLCHSEPRTLDAHMRLPISALAR